MRLKTWMLAAAAVLVAVTVTAGVLVMSNAKQATPSAEEQLPNIAKVTKGKLSATVALDGTLTYRARSDGSPYSVINQARGTYTQLPEIGDKVNCGDVLYRVDDRPVLLLCGTVPAYRNLHRGDRGKVVRQLNRNLHKLGYDATAGVHINPDGKGFSEKTKKALTALQHDRGFDVTGALASTMRSSCPIPCGSPR
jgi:Putative peptidoglycan binding domain